MSSSVNARSLSRKSWNRTKDGGRLAASSIVGFGDFIGNGKQDILWRNTADGSVDAWIMNGFTIAAQWLPGAVSLDWQIQATPDVNGNRINSIFWSNVSTGQQVIWTSNGSIFVSGAPFAFAAPEWVVQPQVNVGNVTPQ